MRPSHYFSRALMAGALAGLLAACAGEAPETSETPPPDLPPAYAQSKYATVELSPDLRPLTEDEREILPLLGDALRIMDQLFWQQAYGPKAALLDAIGDADARRFAEINYGPWDRLDDDRPFLPVQPKPATAQFYPVDLQPGELEKAGAVSADGGAALRSPYTVVRRGAEGALAALPYHEFYSRPLQEAERLLRSAAENARRPSLSRYLELRAEALTSDSFRASEEAWTAIGGGALGVALGPIDPGEDHIARTKRAYTGAVWVRRPEWDAKLQRLRSLLADASAEFSGEAPITEGPGVGFVVADLVRLAGSWNAGPKRIVLELPADRELRKRAGTQRIYLRNVARAKFDESLVPLAGELIAEEQRDEATFEAFITNDLLLEMTRADESSARTGALRKLYGEAAWVVDVARANAVALHLSGRLAEEGETGSTPEQHCVAAVASAFRSLRFGSASAQGPASLILLNALLRDGAVVREAERSTYRVDAAKTRRTLRELAERLSKAHQPERVQETGSWLTELSSAGTELHRDLERLAEAGVPIDIAFAP